MYQTTHALPAHTCAEAIESLNARLADSMDFMHQAKKRRMRTFAVASLLTRRRGWATAAAAGDFGLILLAAPCGAQTVPAVGAEAPVSGLIPAKPRTAAEADANRPLPTETIMTQRDPRPSTATPAVRPFHIRVTDEALVDLRQRLATTRWTDQETVTDQSQGVPLATMQALVRYWQTDYDWRKAEAQLNALPQFVTTIDGVDIHFMHVKSRHQNALPLIITHGWPGSVFEQIKLIGPLTDPTKYGGRAEDAFDVVIPSLPVFGFSERPTEAGWMLLHGGFTKWAYGKDSKQSPTRDDVLDNFSLYWLTNTAASAARLYWENRNLNLTNAAAQTTNEISVPVAITVFPDEVIRAQEAWARRAFPNLIYFHEADRGGHFAAWGQPELFVAELRTAFRSLR